MVILIPILQSMLSPDKYHYNQYNLNLTTNSTTWPSNPIINLMANMFSTRHSSLSLGFTQLRRPYIGILANNILQVNRCRSLLPLSELCAALLM